MKRLLAGLIAVALAGCASTHVKPAAPVASVPVDTRAAVTPTSPFLALADVIDQLAANPIFKLAVKDAADTLAWIQAAPDAPKDPLLKAQASVCPTMIQLAVGDFQAKAAGMSAQLRALDAGLKTDLSTGPELVLFLTKQRYSTAPTANPQAQFQQIQTDVYNRVSAVLNGCRDVLPTKQLADVAKIAGVSVATGGAAGILP